MLVPSPLSVKCTPFRNMQNDKTNSSTMTASTPVATSPLVRRKATSPESNSQHSNCSATSSASENTSQNRAFLGTGIENQLARTAGAATKTTSANKFASILNVNVSVAQTVNKVGGQPIGNSQAPNNAPPPPPPSNKTNQSTCNSTVPSTTVDTLLKTVQRSPSSGSPTHNVQTNHHNRSTNFSIEAIMSKNPNAQAAAAAAAMIASAQVSLASQSAVQPASLAVSPAIGGDQVQCSNSAIQAQLNHLYQQQAAAAVAAQFNLLAQNPLTGQANPAAINSASINSSLSSNASPLSPTTTNSALFSHLHQLTHLGHLYPFANPLQSFPNLASLGNLPDLRNLNGLTTNSLLNGSALSPPVASANKQTPSQTTPHLTGRSLNSPTVYMDSFESSFRCSPASSELTNTSIENSANGSAGLLVQNPLELLRSNSTPADRINLISSPVQSRGLVNGDALLAVKDEQLTGKLNNSTTSNGSHCKSLDVKCSSALSTTSSSSTTSNSPNPWEEKLKPKYNCKQLAGVSCHLENKELWDKFAELGTEMIITKSGRYVLICIAIVVWNDVGHPKSLVLEE